LTQRLLNLIEKVCADLRDIHLEKLGQLWWMRGGDDGGVALSPKGQKLTPEISEAVFTSLIPGFSLGLCFAVIQM
jgi:hypothetical protein